MIKTGLSTAQQRAFHSLLASPHLIDLDIHLMDLNHNYLGRLDHMFHDGQVNIDNTGQGDTTRGLSLQLFDPFGRTGLDTTAPTDGALYLDRMIQVYYTVRPLTSNTYYAIPVFTGPISKIARDDVMLSIDCVGKEIIAIPKSWRVKTYKKGAKKTAVIFDLLRNFTGEIRLSIPDLGSKLSADLAISNESSPWLVAKSLAASMNYQLFYDGRGWGQMRPYPRTPIFTFSDYGEDALVLKKPQIGYDDSSAKNAMIVIGSTVKGKKKVPLRVTRVAPSTHPLSPYNLGRAGVGRYLFDKIEDENINSVAEANAIADDRINKALLETVTVSFDCAPVPHLEPGDIYRLQTANFAMNAFLHQMTIPLLHSGTATVGYLRRANPVKRNIRRNRK